MGLFNKIAVQLKGLFNDGVDAVSDDERTIRQNLRTMGEDMDKVKEALTDANAQRIFLQTEITTLDEKIARAKAYARKAVSKGNDASAIKFLSEIEDLEKEKKDISVQYNDAVEILKNIQSRWDQLEKTYQNFKTRADNLSLRQKTVSASETVNSIASKVMGDSSSTSSVNFENAEKELRYREARSEALSEHIQKPEEDIYAELDKEDTVSLEDRLAELKKEVKK